MGLVVEHVYFMVSFFIEWSMLMECMGFVVEHVAFMVSYGELLY